MKPIDVLLLIGRLLVELTAFCPFPITNPQTRDCVRTPIDQERGNHSTNHDKSWSHMMMIFSFAYQRFGHAPSKLFQTAVICVYVWAHPFNIIYLVQYTVSI